MPARPLTPNEDAEKKIERIESPPGAPRGPTPQGGAEEGQQKIARIIGGS